MNVQVDRGAPDSRRCMSGIRSCSRRKARDIRRSRSRADPARMPAECPLKRSDWGTHDDFCRCLRMVTATACDESLGVDRGVERRPGKSRGHVCIRSMSREESLLVKRVVQPSVLLLTLVQGSTPGAPWRPTIAELRDPMIKAAPAATLVRHQRRPPALGRPRPTRAGPTRCRSPLISQAHPATQPGLHCAVFPAIHCPAPGHRV